MTTPTTVKVQLKLRQDTSSGWSAVNPILLAGELGRESNTGKIKIGDGSTAWNSLAYQPFGALITNADISATAEIAVSKLADGAARQLLQTDTAGTGVEWTSNVDVPGTLDVTGAATFDAAVTIAGNSTAASFIPTGSTVPTNGVYLSAANNVSIATNSTERLRIDAAGQIEAVSLGSAAAPTFSWTGDPNTGIYSPGADQVAISTNGSRRFSIDASGNVGVNTSTPQRILHAFGGASDNCFLATSIASNAYIGFADVGTTDQTGLSVRLGSSGNNLIFNTGGTTERMRLDSSGRLCLGTSSPAALCHLRSDANSAVTHLYLQNRNAGASAQSRIAFTDSANDLSDNRHAYIGAVTTGAGANGNSFVIATNPDGGSALERVWVSSTGNVGIGTTSPLGFLHVETPATTAGWQLRLDSVGLANESGFYRDASDNYEMVLRNGLGGLSYIKNSGNATDANLVFFPNGAERARIDSSGRLLVGTSSAFGTGNLQVFGSSNTGTYTNNAFSSNHVFIKSRSTTAGGFTVVQSDDELGGIVFQGTDGSANVSGARIFAAVDGTPGTNDMPGRLVISVTADGASSPTEALRITNDRVIARNQGAPAAVNATATLTVANLKAGIITSTSAAATDMTLPTGTDTQAGFSGTYDNFTFEWSVINTGPSLVRVLAGTAHTIVGSGSVATGTSGRFASRRTAANTFVTYRLS